MSGVFGNPWLYNPSDDFFTKSISNSLRFTAAQTPYLTFGQTKTPTDIAKWTVNFWLKRSDPVVASDDYDTVWGVEGPGNTAFTFLNGQLYLFINYNTSGGQARLITTRTFVDTSAWYNFHVSFDRANSTDAHKVRFYVNGVEETSFSTDERNLIGSSTSTGWNVNGQSAAINRRSGTQDSRYHNGYVAQFYNIDGQALDPTSFIEISDDVCKPKSYTGSFGNQGWLLEFKESGVGTGASNTVGADTSGNDNHWSSFNVESHDQTADSPTQNHCQLLPMTNIALSEGNLKMTTSRTGNWDGTIGNFAVTSGKWYYEVRPTVTTDSTFRCVIGWQGNQALQTVTYHGKGASGSPYGTLFDNYLVNVFTTSFYKDGGTDGTMTAASSGDVINVAADFDNGKIYFGINGTYYANDGGTDGDPAGGTNESLSGIDLTAQEYVPAFHIRSDNAVGGNQMIVNFGQEGTFVGTKTAGGNSDANGQGNFFNPVPSGFLALVASNLPDVAIGPQQDSLSTDHFTPLLWSGSGASSRAFTGLGFRPDWVWIKTRNQANEHSVFDSVRGAAKDLEANDIDAEQADNVHGYINSFDSDGFTVIDGSSGSSLVNYSSGGTTNTYVSWNWKAGGATPTKTYKVVVDVDSGQNKYRFRNSANSATFATYAPTIELQEGGTYVFDWSDDGTNSATGISAQSHPIRFSTTSNGTHGGGSEYTTGVVKDDSAYTTTITVAAGAPTLYYYCQYHSGMGGQVNTNSTFGSSNFDGTIQSIVSVNTVAGLSIVSYTGNDADGATVGHGLSQTVEVAIVKRRDNTAHWQYLHKNLSSGHVLLLSSTLDEQDYTNFSSGGIDNLASTTFSLEDGSSNGDNVNKSGGTYIAYCFHTVSGHCEVGSFLGNGSSDGTFVALSLRPQFILVKNRDLNGTNFLIFDNQRSVGNPTNDALLASGNNTEFENNSNFNIDMFSNGFRPKSNYGDINQSNNRMVYIAIGESPLKFSNAR